MGTNPGGHASLQWGGPLTYKEGSVALSWVIGALSFPILEGSMLQGEGDHVLGQEETESEAQKAQRPEQCRGADGSAALTM